MKRGDVAWAAALAVVVCILVIPTTRAAVIGATHAHPYPMGFAKFALLATLGELLGLRVKSGDWRRPVGLPWRALVWGLMGMSLVLIFQIFSSGVRSALSTGLLPGGAGLGPFGVALWISVIMNLAWAPTMMAAHRITDSYIELTCGNSPAGPVRFADVITHIDWQMFFSFVVARTIPFFWIPAHTITFLLPPDFRVLMAAFLSIALGAILAFAVRTKHVQTLDASTTLPERSLQISGQ